MRVTDTMNLRVESETLVLATRRSSRQSYTGCQVNSYSGFERSDMLFDITLGNEFLFYLATR